MSRRSVGLALLAAGLLIHLGVTLPARSARDASREAFAHQREERARLRADVARLERRRPATPAPAPAGDAAAARVLRQSLLQATRGLPVDEVEIAVQPDRRGGIAARGRLSASGSQADLLRVAGRLAERVSGVRLERVQLVGGTGRHRIEAETVSLRAGS